MAMVKRANGKIENFTDNDGDEVKAEEVKEVVWADEKKERVDPETNGPVVQNSG